MRGKLIQVHDEPRLNPKAAWVHYRWVQTGTRLRIQAERERLFLKMEKALCANLFSQQVKQTDMIPSLCRLLSIRVIAIIPAGLDDEVCFFLYTQNGVVFFISVLIGIFTDLDTSEVIVKWILPVTPWNGLNGRL